MSDSPSFILFVNLFNTNILNFFILFKFSPNFAFSFFSETIFASLFSISSLFFTSNFLCSLFNLSFTSIELFSSLALVASAVTASSKPDLFICVPVPIPPTKEIRSPTAPTT